MTTFEIIAVIMLCVIVAFVFAYLFQDCFNRLKDIKAEEDELRIYDLDVEDLPDDFDSDTSDEDVQYTYAVDQTLVFGCYVYDVLTHTIGIFMSMELGEDNDDYAQVITMVGNTVYVYRCVPKSLQVVERA